LTSLDGAVSRDDEVVADHGCVDEGAFAHAPALQTTERDTRAPAATCVRGPRLVGPTMTAFGQS
jgi:hypothetical protein